MCMRSSASDPCSPGRNGRIEPKSKLRFEPSFAGPETIRNETV
jgi:hypothetical protein